MRRTPPRPSIRTVIAAVIAFAWLAIAIPAQAAVTITFWNHELGNSFPHAFVTLRGTPDAGGDPVDLSVGFTAKAVTPALLWGTVAGKIERPTTSYMNGSHAQFSVVLSDAQYTAELALITAWDDTLGGDSHYNLGKRNCIHFVEEAARAAGLTGLDQPKLMKKPRSYLQAVAAANPGAIIPVGMDGAAYLAGLPPLATVPAPRVAPDLHVVPPPPAVQPAGTISTMSRVDSNPG